MHFLQLVMEYYDDFIYRPTLETRAMHSDLAHPIRKIGEHLDMVNLGILELFNASCDSLELMGELTSETVPAQLRATSECYKDDTGNKPPDMLMSPASHSQMPAGVESHRDLECPASSSYSHAREHTEMVLLTSRSEKDPQNQVLPRVVPLSRRKGSQTPRTFTGSFRDLEDGLRALKIERVSGASGESDLPRTKDSDHIHAQDFGSCVNPDAGTAIPCDEPSASSQTCQEETNKGKCEGRRRLPDRARAQTLNDPLGSLDSWLGDRAGTSISTRVPEAVMLGGHCQRQARSECHHREKTI